jgi:hypothetical protein
MVNRALGSVSSTVENNLDAMENVDVAIGVAGTRDQGRIVPPGVLHAFAICGSISDGSSAQPIVLPRLVATPVIRHHPSPYG